MLNLVELFDSLPATSDGENRFLATPIEGYERHRLGKDAQGRPLLLISLNDTQSQRASAPIVLEHLTVMHNVDCRISRPDGIHEAGRFTVVRCTGGDVTLHTYFLRIASTIVVSLSERPSQLQVTGVINKLIELFRAMTKPPRKSTQGLWAELFLIARTRQPAVLIQAWHAMPEDRYDFALDNQQVEVKSVAGRVRQHYFSLEQLQPPEGTNVLIASMFVERTQAGPSIVELAEKIRTRISGDPDLLLYMDRIIGLTLGDSWRYASEERFDGKLTEESLAFFEASAIPSVNPNLPFGVSEVRFKSDLTGIPTAKVVRYREEGGLFKVVLC